MLRNTLEKLGCKVVGPNTLVILEDCTYCPHMARTWDDNEYEFLGLYRVTTSDGSDHYVLAEDEAGARSQVTCLCKDEHPDWMTAVNIPLMIRGWGRRKFRKESSDDV